MEQIVTSPNITSRKRKTPSNADPIRGYWYLKIAFILIATGSVAAIVFIARRIHEAFKT